MWNLTAFDLWATLCQLEPLRDLAQVSARWGHSRNIHSYAIRVENFVDSSKSRAAIADLDGAALTDLPLLDVYFCAVHIEWQRRYRQQLAEYDLESDVILHGHLARR